MSDITLEELRKNQEAIDKFAENLSKHIQKTIISPLILLLEEMNEEDKK